MPIVLLVAAAGIVAGALLAARGRAGQMAMFPPDAAPWRASEVTAPEVSLLRPPLSLLGYNAAVTDEALRMIARAMTARDVEIATLRRALAEAQDGRGAPDGRPEQDAGE